MSDTTIINRETPPATGGTAKPAVVVTKTRLGQKKRNLTPVYVVLALLAIALGIWYVFFKPSATAPLVVRYSAVDLGEVSRGVTATGTLQAVTTVQVGSQISGMVKELYADFNTKVKRGQVLAVLDPANYNAAVTQAKANLSKAEADLEAASKDEARSRQLLKMQLIAQADYDLSKNKFQDAQASVKQVQAQLDQAEVNLGYTTIKSPVDGVVQARNVDKGQTVAAGLNVTTMFVIAEDLTKMQVSASVDEADIGQVQPGQPVKFTVDAYPGQQFDGSVSQVRINPVTAQNVVTYAVIIMTDNPDQKLLPGMTATVTIVNASRENVLRVPIAATRFQPPPEFFTEMHLSDTLSKSRRQRGAGDTTHRHMGQGGAEQGAGAGQGSHNWQGRGGQAGGAQANNGDSPRSFATLYVKPKGKTTVTPVRAVLGLTDANYAEVLQTLSQPPLQAGDSIVVAAFTMQATPAAGSSPINNRPPTGGGGGRGGGGRF